LRALPMRWKTLLAYLLTDEAYAVTILNYERDGAAPAGHWFFLGAGLTLWVSWQLSTAAGILLGTALPESWPLDFALPITFIALIVPALKDRPAVAASLTAGTVAVFAYGLPYKLGLMLAGLLGILVGTALEGRKSSKAVSPLSRSLPKPGARGTREGAGSQDGPGGGIQ
jgi:branched chain amino acid efflux pump